MKKLLDLYCCGGGASLGYHQAGFEVVGVDIDFQKNYPFNFVQSDAIEFLNKNYQNFDLIHASPPCQSYSKSSKQWRMAGKEYPDLIQPTREALIRSGVPWVIENVPESPLINPVTLCGSMFNLKTYRHRLFESSFKIHQKPHPPHILKNAKMGRPPQEDEMLQIVGHFSGVPLARTIIGAAWMNQYELAQSIPASYTKYVGSEFLNSLESM